jgi:transcriptional regulator with XRE-family HTH domain
LWKVRAKHGALRQQVAWTVVEIDDPRAEQWRKATARALDESPLSQAELARSIDRAPQQLSHWLLGRAGPPPPDVVFAIEDALGCVDQLAHLMGYVRAKPVDTATHIAQDPGLDEVDRATLLRLYRMMIGE